MYNCIPLLKTSERTTKQLISDSILTNAVTIIGRTDHLGLTCMQFLSNCTSIRVESPTLEVLT